MQVRNTSNRFGAVTIGIHWLVAIAVFSLFGLGYWMVDLSYYDDWYRKGPDIHRSIGMLLMIVMLLRLAWRFVNPVPPRYQTIATSKFCRPTVRTCCCMF